MHEIINVTVFEPDKALFKQVRNDKAEVRVFTCDRKDSCDYFKAGSCLNVGTAFGNPCPHGKKSVSTGFTKKARNYYSWISKQKETYNDYLYALKRAPNRIAKIGDFVALPYSFMDKNEQVPFAKHSSFFVTGQPILSNEDFTADAIDQICRYRPMAMMGGEITDYQKKSVPKFVYDLKTYYPEKYEQAAAKYPYIADIAASYSFVGRKALIKTMPPSVLKLNLHGTWEWDGEKLKSTSYKGSFFPFDGEITTTVIPSDKATFEITDNSQVSETTEFVD